METSAGGRKSGNRNVREADPIKFEASMARTVARIGVPSVAAPARETTNRFVTLVLGAATTFKLWVAVIPPAMTSSSLCPTALSEDVTCKSSGDGGVRSAFGAGLRMATAGGVPS